MFMEHYTMMKTFNVTQGRACAFCKYWYDPGNTAIRPKVGYFWQYDTTQKKRCMKKVAAEMPATAACGDYECKV